MRQTLCRFVLMVTCSGCVGPARYVGLIDVSDGNRVQLIDSQGHAVRLATGESADLFAHLGGCGAWVDGPRRGRTVVVRQWVVTDAGDGSAPYIGVLEHTGMRWSILDRQTGATLFLVEESLGGLDKFEGRPVLVAGYVIGPNTINVVTWRSLDE